MFLLVYLHAVGVSAELSQRSPQDKERPRLQGPGGRVPGNAHRRGVDPPADEMKRKFSKVFLGKKARILNEPSRV